MSPGSRGCDVFERCVASSKDEAATRRQVAADVIAGLGVQLGVQPPFAGESWAVLRPLLSDTEAKVVRSALFACGHLNVGEPAVLSRFAHDPDWQVRDAAVHALFGRSDDESISAQILLSRDEVDIVRDWATFGLSTQTRADTAEVREALLARLSEVDAEIRGEALIGLARRHDLRVLPYLERELAGEFHGSWCLEAARELALPSLSPLLAALRSRLDAADLERFGQDLTDAIDACASRA